jgi:rRNA maturation RNase YbeY
VRYVLQAEGRACLALGIILTDHDTVLHLNRTYLEHDYLTDVLSFNLGAAEGPVEGEVYIDLDTAAERHLEFGASFEEEVHRYTVHGLLHLLGYDDDTADARAAMKSLEDRYLAAAR